MNNISQTEKNEYLVYILSEQKKTSEIIKKALSRTLPEDKIAVSAGFKNLPRSFNSNTYIITEYDENYIKEISSIKPKRNVKLYVYIENLNKLNERDVIFLIKHNIDHVIHSGNIEKLAYESFIDAKIFKKKRYNAFIDKESTLLEDLSAENEDVKDTGINIYGISEHIAEVVKKICRIAPSESSVLITGESGTGKELIARLIHDKSKRGGHPMVSVNCGAFPEGLLESELFGYKKGAFTGAFTDKLGRFDLADKSTLFLDEIGDMSPSIQVKLLRVIQEREIEPVGSVKTKKIDVRIISATNKNLEELIAKNLFREDFYYRINVIPVHLLPLRERKVDIIILIYYFLKKFGDYQNESVYGISEDAFYMLLNYPWTGNVRELENLMEMLVVLNEGGLITEKDIPDKYLKKSNNIIYSENLNIDEKLTMRSAEEPFQINLKEKMEAAEREIIEKAMKISGGVKEKAAKMLGLNRTTLIEKLKKYEKNKK
jgi:transcriptional regulator with GAF, ATPase, and Fis domain